MKRTSRVVLFGVLTIVLLSAACTGQEGSPTAAATTVPGNETVTPFSGGTDTAGTATPGMEGTPNTTATIDTATLPAGTDTGGTAVTDTTQTPSVPVTGEEVVLLECQYCIDGMPHALLILPDTSTYETVADAATLSTPEPGMGCNTVDNYSGRQVVICRSQQNTSLNLNICRDGNNCTQLLVELQSCPVTGQPGGTETPAPGLPKDTPEGGTIVPDVGATDTPVVVSPTAIP